MRASVESYCKRRLCTLLPHPHRGGPGAIAPLLSESRALTNRNMFSFHFPTNANSEVGGTHSPPVNHAWIIGERLGFVQFVHVPQITPSSTFSVYPSFCCCVELYMCALLLRSMVFGQPAVARVRVVWGMDSTGSEAHGVTIRIAAVLLESLQRIRAGQVLEASPRYNGQWINWESFAAAARKRSPLWSWGSL